MRRLGSGGGAPIALILALVFPAVVSATLALAYYGLRYTDSMSRPIEALFREYAREEAEKLIGDVESRIDGAAVEFFRRVAAEKRVPELASVCDLDLGSAVASFVVLGPGRTPECVGGPGDPLTRQALRAGWDRLLGRLNWGAVRLDSYHHYHAPAEADSALVVYTARRTEDDQRYYVAARIRDELIRKTWLSDALGRVRKNLQVAVLDADGVVAGEWSGERTGRPDERFQEQLQLGKALYGWQVRVAPQNTEVFRAEAERRKLLGPLLITLSIVIIAVGLGIVSLAVLAERRASRMKSDFIANVSHELKTPLSLIRMFGEMVASGRHKGEHAAREYGGIITRESERLSHLIDNVLDFARLERGKASYDFGEAQLGEVLARALDVCRYRLDKEKVQLRARIEPALPPVRLDENAMTLMILNLVDNAIKYGAEGGEMEVTLSRAPGGVALAVRDFGPGIAPEDQRRIFERFYRARAARDRNVRGSGIGLALVQHIAEAHGGWVRVESPVAGDAASPAGALFRVFVPAAVAATEGAATSTAADTAPARSTVASPVVPDGGAGR